MMDHGNLKFNHQYSRVNARNKLFTNGVNLNSYGLVTDGITSNTNNGFKRRPEVIIRVNTVGDTLTKLRKNLCVFKDCVMIWSYNILIIFSLGVIVLNKRFNSNFGFENKQC